jgi:MFS family permease
MSLTAAREPRLAAIVIAAMTVVQIVTTISTNLIPAIAPIMAMALGVAPALVGVQVSLIYCTAILGSLVSGSPVRRLGALFACQLSLLLIAAGLALSSLPSLWWVAAGALLMGMTYGLPIPAASHLLARFTAPERRNFIFSLKQAGVPVGVALAGLVAPSLAQGIGWNAPLVAGSIAALVLALALAPLRGRLDDDRVAGAPLFAMPHVEIMSGLALSSIRRLFAAGVLLAGVQVSMTAFLVIVLVTEYGFTPVAAGIVLAATQGTGVVGRLIAGAVADRLGGAVTLTGLAIMTAALILALALVDPSYRALVVIVLVIMGFSANAWTGVYMAEAVRLAPSARVGETTAVLLVANFLGVLFGPSLFGFVGALVGYRSAFALQITGSIAAAVATMLVRRAARA